MEDDEMAGQDDEVVEVPAAPADAAERTSLVAHAKGSSRGSGTESDSLAPEGQRPPTFCEVQTGDLIKSVIYGGLDAVINSASTVAAVYGCGLSARVAVSLGFANLIADGIAMALGDYLSSKAEFNFAVMEMRREQWEYDNHFEGEKAEMVELLEGKGFESPDAIRFIDLISKNREFFVNFMMVEELGIDVPDDAWGPYRDGVVMFVSYTTLGALPLLPYGFAVAAGYTAATPLVVTSIGTTLLALIILGLIQGCMTKQNLFRSAIFMFLIGCVSAIIALSVGVGLSMVAGNPEAEDCP